MRCAMGLLVLGVQLAVGATALWAEIPGCPSTTLAKCHEVGEGPQTALTWNCWQETLNSSGRGADTYKTLRLKVTFTRSGFPATSFFSHAFWDGTTESADVVRVRAMFPSAGTCTWTLTCEEGPLKRVAA